MTKYDLMMSYWSDIRPLMRLIGRTINDSTINKIIYYFDITNIKDFNENELSKIMLELSSYKTNNHLVNSVITKIQFIHSNFSLIKQ